MIKLILASCIMMSCAVGLQSAQTDKIQILIDNQPATFSPAPISKDGVWLVPIESFCKQLGLKVEYPDGVEMAVICGGEEESELCVPINFGEDVFSINNVNYAKIESIMQPFGYEIYMPSETQLEVIHPQQLAPKFTLPDLEDNPKSLKSLRGKKTLLYIWGSW